ncbi:MAG: hypothetical protein K2N05_00540 [Muribaculaceae bacterium]|nr:hypothetical protein [Muribaculaceae bacterium]
MERLDIDSIKDAVYEFEGLLELAALREDKMKDLFPLLKGKLDVINAYFKGVDYSQDWEEADDDEIDDIDIISPYGSLTEDEEETPHVSEEKAETTVIEKSAESEKDESSEKGEEPAIHAEDKKETESEEPLNQEPAEKEETVEKEDQEPLYVFEETDEIAVEEAIPTPQISVTSEVTANAAAQVRTPANGTSAKPAFCVNDRFRFRRELFKNSDSEFNYAMNLVATMDGYDEAEEYFIGELGWDFEKPEVIDFMAIIRNYFEK